MVDDPADPASPVRLGRTDFDHCHFLARDMRKRNRHETRADGSPWFCNARFSGPALFMGAQFDDPAEFFRAQFSSMAVFANARFNADINFASAQFKGSAEFFGARFLGSAQFHNSQFNAGVSFNGAQFDGPVEFGNAWFGFPVDFDSAHFEKLAIFNHAEFENAVFNRAEFRGQTGFSNIRAHGSVTFNDARFAGWAEFDGAEFNGSADFNRVRFDGSIEFGGVTFKGSAQFRDARFESAIRFGPLVADRVDLRTTTFLKRMVVAIEADSLLAMDAWFEHGVEFRVRYAKVSLWRTHFGGPSSLSGVAEPFIFHSEQVAPSLEQATAPETGIGSASLDQIASSDPAQLDAWIPLLVSVQETDVSPLIVSDVDLRWCRFAGAHQLDKLRLEGRSPFNRPPRGVRFGWSWPPMRWWSTRRVLAEEHPWRAGRSKSDGWAKAIPHGADGVSATAPSLGPERLVVLYRSLRKVTEDAKNEAGAGDFYYGEMEARRYASTTARWERALLTLYWMISGYGQRAGRALAALMLLVGVLFALLIQFGLTTGNATQQVTGTIPAAVAGRPAQITMEVTPTNPTLPPQEQRWTSDRMGRAIRIALGSVVFRESDQKLTVIGLWTVMAGRALGPLLLVLTALAIRARVKR